MGHEGFDDITLQVIVPFKWSWDSLPEHAFRLHPIFLSEVTTFRGLLDRCWDFVCTNVSQTWRVRCVCPGVGSPGDRRFDF